MGKGQAFGGKADMGAAGILKRAAIGADAVIMGDAGIWAEGHCATHRRVFHIGQMRCKARAELRQKAGEDRAFPAGFRQAQHGALLIDFAAAAQDCQ